jgi:hypothetical protein
MAALLFLPACERADRDGPATPRSTTASEAPAGPRPALTSQPSPSADETPDRTARPSTSPEPSALPEDDSLVFHFGSDVDAFDRSLIVRAVEVTRALLQDESGLRPPAAVFAYESPNELAAAFADGALAQNWRAEGMAARLIRAIAESSYRGIVINTGLAEWKAMDPATRLRVVAHEFVHVIQLEHAGPRVADETLFASNTVTPPAGPYWLLEGSAEVVSWLVLQELSLGSFAAALLEYAEASKAGRPDLRPLEAYFGYSQSGEAGLGTSVLAVHYLMQTHGLSRLFDFWNEVRRSPDWQTAFIRSFGASPADFYASFEQHYENLVR